MFHCANPVSPTGGDKDISPPEVVLCDPPNESVHFSSPNIRITFNEFVSLKSASSEIFISPPLSQKPDYKLRGKTVVIDFEDTLAPNTTYIISFGKSIADITEGNLLPNFRYVFSTGAYIDSLTIAGQVINAFDNEPVPEVFAELYSNVTDTIPVDSLPFLVPPLYITETDENGMFVFTNLREGDYKLVILEDKSGDFIYTRFAERIAFSDSLIIPWGLPASVSDSGLQDSTQVAVSPVSPQLVLRLFEEIDSTQEVVSSELIMNNLFRIIFKFPPDDPGIHPLNLDTATVWCMEEYSLLKDTVLLFTTIKVPDSLILQVWDGPEILDTVIISPTNLALEKKPKKKGKEDAGEEPERLTMNWKPRGPFSYQKFPLTGQLSYPVSEYDLSGFKLISNNDTVTPTVEFTDQLLRNFKVTSSWKEATSYKLLIPDSAFISYNGLSNDTILHSFQTVVFRDLGSLTINVNLSQHPGSYIIQLLSEKGNMVEEKYLSESGQIKFAFIKPAKYSIKAIYDANQNRRWDTGDYLNKVQPETVIFFPKTIEIRGNWDVEEEWKL